MANEIKITLIGGPTALVEIGSLRLLTDPTFDPPGEHVGGVVLTKTVGPALSAERVGRVDAVLLSHDQHADNLDAAGRQFLAQAPVVLTTPAAAGRLGSRAKGLKTWESAELRDSDGRRWTITSTPARHGPEGIQPISGEVTGFVISGEGTPLIYVTGDTVWYDGTMEVANRFQPRVVLAFAGGAQARGPFYLTMNTNDVVETARYFPKATIVPVHHEGWTHFKQSQEDLVKTFTALGIRERLQTIEPGATVVIER